jgi:hypothetical protein
MDEMQSVISQVLFILIPAVVFFSFRRLGLTARIFLALIALFLAAVAIPGYWRDRDGADRNACINNLRQIQIAKRQWAEANHKSPMDIPTVIDLVGTNKYFRYMPICPRGGKYNFGAVNQNPTCSLAEHGHKLE